MIIFSSSRGNVELEIVKSEFNIPTDKLRVECDISSPVGTYSVVWEGDCENGELAGAYFNQGVICSAIFGESNNKMTARIRLDCTLVGLTNAHLVSTGGTLSLNTYSMLNILGDIERFNGTVNIILRANFPIFASGYELKSAPPLYDITGNFYWFANWGTTDRTYTNQISTKDYSNINQAINYYSVVNEIPVNQVYSVRCLLKKNGAVVSGSNKAYDFRIQPDSRIWFVLTNRINGDGSANMILHISASPWLQKIAYAPDDTYTETVNLDSEYWFGNWQDYDTGDAYTGICSTNIPIFDSNEKGDAYGRGEIGIDESINGGDTSFSRSTIGDDLSSSDIPTINLSSSGVGCYIYALSEAEIKDLMANYLYVTDPTLTEQIQNGLWYWGNNPIDFMIDCYYVPFSISSFYDTVVANMKFGTYQFINSSFNAVKESNGNRLTLFNTTFEGIYGDWRDYTQFKYDLYLPFVGFFTLDNYKYLNHTVRCEMMFDLSTHNVRYYLFVDGIITDRVDGSVGVNMPLMASDMVNKARMIERL